MVTMMVEKVVVQGDGGSGSGEDSGGGSVQYLKCRCFEEAHDSRLLLE